MICRGLASRMAKMAASKAKRSYSSYISPSEFLNSITPKTIGFETDVVSQRSSGYRQIS